MKVVCIGDTHGLHNQVDVPDGDVLIIAGDITSVGKLEQFQDFCDWLKNQHHQYKIVIAGNHDVGLTNNHRPQILKMLDESAIYLEDNELFIPELGWIYGTPWSPKWEEWTVFNYPRNSIDLKQKWNSIFIKTNILIVHTPPFGILDTYSQGKHMGCEKLKDRLSYLPNLKLVIFGHAHSGYGVLQQNKTTYVNASICEDNKRYQVVNKPYIWESE